MCSEKYITGLFRRTHLYFKSLGVLFFVPLAAVHILIPFVAIITYKKYGAGDEFVSNITQYSQLLIPICSSLWEIFILHEYVEGYGNELLYVCKIRSKLRDVVLPFLLFLITVVLQYAVYCALVPAMGFELLRLILVSVFYFGLAYFLMFLSKSTSMTIMCLIVYTAFNFLALFNLGVVVFPIYFDLHCLSYNSLCFSVLPLFACGIGFIALGVHFNKKKLKYN